MNGAFLISLFDNLPVWLTIVPIIICSIIAVALFVERTLFYRKISIDYRAVMKDVVQGISESGTSYIYVGISGQGGPVIDMIRNILDRWNSSMDHELVVRDESEKTITRLERFGSLMATIGTVAPMLGLFGTVTGMMKSFSALAKMGNSAQDLLARGIAEALITTALGLLVAIPSVTYYNYMVARVQGFVREVEYIANVFMDIGIKFTRDNSK